MPTCEACIHYELCLAEVVFTYEDLKEDTAPRCRGFRDRANFIELPCKLGARVFALGFPCVGCVAFEEVLTEPLLEMCNACERREVTEVAFEYAMLPDFGKTIFLTRIEAEKALAERNVDGKA